MRRAEREITDSKRIEAFIAQEQIIRVAFQDNEDIYIVPVNYGYTCTDGQYTFYFHGAKAGRKFELSKKNRKVGFEIDGRYKVLEAEMACDFSAAFQSVIGTGTLCLVEDVDEKREGLNIFMRQIAKKKEWDYDEKMLEAVAVFRLDVEKLTCKAK